MAFRARAFFGAIVILVLAHAPAEAHPLGNFTINHLSKVSVERGHVAVRYVLDMAEIPAFSAIRDADPNGKPDASQLATWARATATTLLPQLTLQAGSTNVPLVLGAANARTRPGAGGLPTLYLTFDATGTVPDGTTSLAFHDGTYSGRLGWHDAIVAPQTEPTHELTAYPNAVLASARATTDVAATLADGRIVSVAAHPAAPVASVGAPSLERSNQLADLVKRGTSDWGFVALTFLIAIALGSLHALEPGHGKTLLAVSLVGARATVKQAAILAIALTIAHTIGVLLLGVGMSFVRGLDYAKVYPWIDMAGGIAISIIGARAVQRQIERRRPLAHAHAHDHAAAHPHEHLHEHSAHAADHAADHAGGHAHAHDDDLDDLEHARAHAIPGSEPLTFGGAVWAAMSGGIAPCPAAIVVLLTALSLNEAFYGVLLVIAFSFGLAITLTGLGIAVVRSAGLLQRFALFDRFAAYGPLVSAVVISTIGAILVGRAFAQQGITVSPLVVSAVVALAIASYAFARPVAHRHVEAV